MLTFLLTGCINEDMDDCERTSLYFSYQGDGVTQIFRDKIQKVDLYVFDAQNQHILNQTLDRRALEDRQGTKLNLSPGDYQIICIGNAFEDTQITDPKTGAAESIFMAHPNYFSGQDIPGNDSLYMGIGNIHVPGSYWLNDTISFMSSHLKVYVEVRGLASAEELPTKANPSTTLTIEQLSPCTDFTNTPCKAPVCYIPNANYDIGKRMMISRFNIMRHPKNCEVTFNLTYPDGSILHSFNLRDFLTQNPAINISKQEALIPISIEFKGFEVSISVPDWKVEDVSPIL